MRSFVDAVGMGDSLSTMWVQMQVAGGAAAAAYFADRRTHIVDRLSPHPARAFHARATRPLHGRVTHPATAAKTNPIGFDRHPLSDFPARSSSTTPRTFSESTIGIVIRCTPPLLKPISTVGTKLS